ncbi:MAG: hypothetical protein AB8F95_05505 [Bacteroidia bacterium]
MLSKKVATLLVSLIACSSISLACDVCGCMPLSLGNAWTGMQNKHVLSLESRYVRFHSHDGTTGASDRLVQVNLAGRFVVGKRSRFSLNVPFSRLSRDFEESSDPNIAVKGLGDVSLMAEYQIWRSSPDSMGEHHHKVWLGGGIKAPTGAFQANKTSFFLPPNFQMGTGSWDWLGSLMYQGDVAKWSWTVSAIARLSSENQLGFKLPDMTQVQGLLQRQFPAANATWVTGGGVYAEYIGTTSFLGINTESSGNGTYGMFNLSYVKLSWALNTSAQLPITTQYSGGNVQAKPRFTLRFSYVL